MLAVPNELLWHCLMPDTENFIKVVYATINTSESCVLCMQN